MNKTTFQAALVAAHDAIESGSFATAWKELAKAQMIMIGLVAEASSGDQRTRYREDLRSAKEILQQAQAAHNAESRVGRLTQLRTGYGPS